MTKVENCVTLPTSNTINHQKTTYVTNGYQRMTYKCSTQSNKRKCHTNFLPRLSIRGYTDEFVNSAICRQNSTAQNISDNQIFFKFPYINDTIDGKIKSIIKGTIFEPFCRKRPSTIVSETVDNIIPGLENKNYY